MKSVKMYIAVILSILIVWYIAFGLILFFRQSSYVYMPSNQVEFSPADVNLAFEDIHVETSDGETISAWYIPADDKEMCVLFFHGQGGNISHRLETIKIINSLGLNCMIFDYRGYGKSSGIPTEAGTYLDGNAVYNWLRENKNINENDMIFWGRSLGCAIAAKLASEIDVKGIILESGFSSLYDMAKRLYPYMPVKWVLRFSYDTVEYLRENSAPLLVIHSREDETVPYDFSKKIYDSYNGSKEFLDITGGHNDGFMVSGDIYIEGVKKWIKSIKQDENKEHLTKDH